MIPENVLRWLELVQANRGPFPAALLLALMNRLSQGDPAASNQYGAQGLFLIHPDTAASFNVEPEGLIDPEVSVRLAVDLLEDRLDKIKAAAAQAGIWNLSDTQALQLLLPAYWWGPVPTINAIAAGRGPDPENVWSYLERGDAYKEFSDSILAKAAEYQAQIPAATGNGSDADTGADTGIGTAAPKSNTGLWVLGVLGLIGLVSWWDSSKGKKKKKGKKKRR